MTNELNYTSKLFQISNLKNKQTAIYKLPQKRIKEKINLFKNFFKLIIQFPVETQKKKKKKNG